MRTVAMVLVISFVIVGMVSAVYGAGTPAEAEDMVKKAITYAKTNGIDKAFAEINNSKGRFTKDDLYVFVYDMKGNCVAHRFNQKMIGKELVDLKDADGKFFVKERIEIVKTKGKGWQDYKFTNPTSKKIENKTAYVEKHESYIFGCGAYKK